MDKFYAGIGSRTTPSDVLKQMTEIARILDRQGYCLRSGGAKGADTAFADGSTHSEIFSASEASVESVALAATLHPAWDHCNDHARRLHGRNCMIILGMALDQPVDFVVCWTPVESSYGGTKMGIRLAVQCKIPVYNLALGGEYERLIKDRKLHDGFELIGK